MNHELVVQQTQIEVETVAQVANAVRAVVQWRVKPKQLSRKLSSLRFVAQSFQRYLERLFSLEEHDGFMQFVVEQQPNRADQIEGLKAQHEEFRRTLRRINLRLDRLSASEAATFENLCHDLLVLIREVERHNTRETLLLQESLTQEDGNGD